MSASLVARSSLGSYERVFSFYGREKISTRTGDVQDPLIETVSLADSGFDSSHPTPLACSATGRFGIPTSREAAFERLEDGELPDGSLGEEAVVARESCCLPIDLYPTELRSFLSASSSSPRASASYRSTSASTVWHIVIVPLLATESWAACVAA